MTGYELQKTRSSQGRAGLQAIIALLILAAVVYTGIQLVPLYWAHWNFKDKVEEKVKFTFVNYSSNHEKKLRSEIISLLKDMGAEYEDKNVKVDVDPRQKKVKVEVWYSKSHNLPFYQNPKQFYVTAESNPL